MKDKRKTRSAGAAQTLALLRDYESRNVTFIEPDGSWPIVWERARGAWVWDVEGRRYLDLTAAFGVAAAGHANPRVVRAGQRQMARLLHAMGDVHPHPLKAQLARELSRVSFERWGTKGKTVFCNSGFEAVEAALKTAVLATGKPGVIAFQGAYHGLGYGTLNATYREHFRLPFVRQLREFAYFVPFPRAAQAAGPARAYESESMAASQRDEGVALAALELQIGKLFRRHAVGAILVEPIQVRGGINIPPGGFLPMLRRICDEHRALLILDEIYTGFGRTGRWFACEHSETRPDLLCLGKALTGGFPLSACVGRRDCMDAAWPPSSGEAIHTSTFLGHPVGCAMALAQLREIDRQGLVARSEQLGKALAPMMESLVPNPRLRVSPRGLGLLAGVELGLPDGRPATSAALNAVKRLLHRGYIFLPEGEHGNVISLTPPLTISERQLRAAVQELRGALTATDPLRSGRQTPNRSTDASSARSVKLTRRGRSALAS
jgi:4-aminobutyrate aminotransferase-like enzyme